MAGQCIARLEGMLSEGVCFEAIEDWISEQGVSPDEKSALWLYAWGSVDQDVRRRVVMEVLEAG